MNAWVEAVANKIASERGKAIHLIVDTDEIICGDVYDSLLEKGKRITIFSDAMELRHQYELLFQGAMRQLEQDLFVLNIPLSFVPYDIEQSSSLCILRLGDLFPALNVDVIKEMPSFWREVVFQNQPRSLPGQTRLSSEETIHFILQDCLGADFPDEPTRLDVIKLAVDLCLREIVLPAEFLALLHLDRFGDILKALTSHTAAKELFAEIWRGYRHFVDSPKLQLAESSSDVSDICDALSNNLDLQKKFTGLLEEGIISPVLLVNTNSIPAWFVEGVHYDVDHHHIIQSELTALLNELPDETAGFEAWMKFAYRWAENTNYVFQIDTLDEELHKRRSDFQLTVEEAFLNWMLKNFQAQIQRPYLPQPTMVQQVLHYLSARYQPGTENPVALVVVDGMSIEDWLLIRSKWNGFDKAWKTTETAILAFVPSLTSVSRKALLSGKLPAFFGDEITSMRKEPQFWQTFWEGRGHKQESIAYKKNLGVGSGYSYNTKLESEVEQIIENPSLSIAAFIVNTVDHMLHAEVLGPAAFHAQIAYWADGIGYLEDFVLALMERFTTIVITSDHGHVFGTGIGDQFHASLAEERALRTRILKGTEYGEMTVSENIIQWPATGLPEEYQVFLPRGLGLFEKTSFSGISHGGVSLEECVIPFIEITR